MDGIARDGNGITDATERNGRIFFDVSSIVRWVGPAVGIIRVERALADYARAKRPDITLSVYDPATASLRALRTEWVDRVTGWDGAIDTVTFDHRRYRSRWRNSLSPRYPLFMALERRRLCTHRPMAQQAIGAAQKILWLPGRLPPPFTDRNGRRLEAIPVDLALGERLSPGPGDTFVTAGYDWLHQGATEAGALKRRHGLRYIVTCYDIIPLLFPEFFAEHDVTAFRRYWHAMFSLADRILVTSRRVEADIRTYCATMGIRVGDIAHMPLGFERRQTGSTGSLPRGLERGRFALFVSTIEPRKGHALLLRIWRRLLETGQPQRHRFKLVFVGRRGWKVEDVLRQIDLPRAFEGTLVHLEHIDDAALAAMYGGAAFCVYPSLYEGFGLPIIEAFSHGKAVLASAGGAIPETVGSLSPCLDPADEDAWFDHIKSWIEDPGARAPYEARIRSSFSHPDWDEAAAQVFDRIGDRHRTQVPTIPS